MTERQRLRQLAGVILEQQTWIGAFFLNRDERWRALLAFVTEGIDPLERAFHAIDPGWHTACLARLKAAGIAMAAAERSHHLESCGHVGRFAVREPP